MPSSTHQAKQRTAKTAEARSKGAAKPAPKRSASTAATQKPTTKSGSVGAQARSGAAKNLAAKGSMAKNSTAKGSTAKNSTASSTGAKRRAATGTGSTKSSASRSTGAKAATGRTPTRQAASTTRSRQRQTGARSTAGAGSQRPTRQPGSAKRVAAKLDRSRLAIDLNRRDGAEPLEGSAEPDGSSPPAPSVNDHISSAGPANASVGSPPLLSRPSMPAAFRRSRQGGVAPFVAPKSRARRAFLRRGWERRGFVPLSPGRRKIRHRILPRTIIGISFVLLAVGVGAAFSGAAFYAYYDKRLSENEQSVVRFVDGFDQQFSDATSALDRLRVESIDDIRDELSPLGDYVDDANGVIGLPATAGESVWHLETRDEDGHLASGAAFAVAEHNGGTAFVTSYSLILASVTAPNPPIELVKGEQRLSAQLWTWDDEYDVAVLVVEETIPTLELATAREQVASIGARTFALSGVGGQGATASPGVLLDQSESGLQHTAPVGALFVGGPLLTGSGKVIGVSTLAYQPHGIDPGRVLSAPDVADLCASILGCAEDQDDVVDIEVIAETAEGATAPQPPEPEPESETDGDESVDG